MIGDIHQPAKDWLADHVQNFRGLLDRGEDPSCLITSGELEIEIRLNRFSDVFNRPVKAELLDDEGENMAVRAFLIAYQRAGLRISQMRRHMELSGYPLWPQWVTAQPDEALTKAGAQLWLRYLLALE